MPTLRKVFLICCAAFGPIGLAGLAACDAPSPISTATDNPLPGETAKTIVRVAATNDMLTPLMISDFERSNPAIHIERVEPRQYPLFRQDQTAELPDILSIPIEDFPYYARTGIAMNLGGYTQGNPSFDRDGLYPIADFFRYENGRHGEGPLFGFLRGWSPGSALLYNKPLFDAASLAYPDPDEPMTWEQLLVTVQALTVAHDGQPVQYGLGLLGEGSIMNPSIYRLQMAQLGKSPWYDNDNKADFTNEESGRVFAYWNEALRDRLGPSLMNRVTDTAVQLFLTNRLALLIADYPFAMQLEQTGLDTDNIGIAPLPVYEDGQRSSPFHSKSAAVIHAGTPHPEAAWTVFEWYMTGRQAEEWTAQGYEFPVSQAQLPLLPVSSSWSRSVIAHFQAQLPYVQALPDFNPYLTEEVLDNLFDKSLAPVVFGQSTLQNAMYRLTQDTNFEIQENK